MEGRNRGPQIKFLQHFIRLSSEDMSVRRMHSGASIGDRAGTAEKVLGGWSLRPVEVWFPTQSRPIRWASNRLMNAFFRPCRARIDATCFAKATSEPFSRANTRRSTSKATARS